MALASESLPTQSLYLLLSKTIVQNFLLPHFPLLLPFLCNLKDSLLPGPPVSVREGPVLLPGSLMALLSVIILSPSAQGNLLCEVWWYAGLDIPGTQGPNYGCHLAD